MRSGTRQEFRQPEILPVFIKCLDDFRYCNRHVALIERYRV